jgi:hypothetical protein
VKAVKIPYPDIVLAMARYDAGDPKRIQHALKVFGFASVIGEREGFPPEMLAALRTAAILHDIGIHNCEKKYGSAAGKYQEKEGPPVARALLAPFGLPEKLTERVCFLIAHHHTYAGIDGPDYQALIEADLLVNLYEDGASPEQTLAAGRKYFRTPTGRALLSAAGGARSGPPFRAQKIAGPVWRDS